MVYRCDTQDLKANLSVSTFSYLGWQHDVPYILRGQSSWYCWKLAALGDLLVWVTGRKRGDGCQIRTVLAWKDVTDRYIKSALQAPYAHSLHFMRLVEVLYQPILKTFFKGSLMEIIIFVAEKQSKP